MIDRLVDEVLRERRDLVAQFRASKKKVRQARGRAKCGQFARHPKGSSEADSLAVDSVLVECGVRNTGPR